MYGIKCDKYISCFLCDEYVVSWKTMDISTSKYPFLSELFFFISCSSTFNVEK